jgi:hypothetical protein
MGEPAPIGEVPSRCDSLNWPQGDGLKRLHPRGGGVSS